MFCCVVKNQTQFIFKSSVDSFPHLTSPHPPLRGPPSPLEKASLNHRDCGESRAFYSEVDTNIASPRGEVSAETTERGLGRRSEKRLLCRLRTYDGSFRLLRRHLPPGGRLSFSATFVKNVGRACILRREKACGKRCLFGVAFIYIIVDFFVGGC